MTEKAAEQRRGCCSPSARSPINTHPPLAAPAPDWQLRVQSESAYPNGRANRMSKRKRVVLNFQQKLDILHQLNEGRSGAVLAKEYGIGTSTISDIKRNADAILQFVANLECRKQIAEKKTRKTAQNTDLDSIMYRWYVEEKEKGAPPPDSAVCAKALEVNSNLSNANRNFKASPGWLRHFKNRHGLHGGGEVGKEKTGDEARRFRSAVKRGGYTLENVYNADEAVLEWKSLPNKDNKPGNAVGVVLCANANASHKLPLWVVGQDADVSPFSDQSIVYKTGKVGTQLLEYWFESHFVPEVKNRQRCTGNVGKVLLVVDDVPWHALDSAKYQIDVFFLKNGLSPPVQPSEVEIRRKFKALYRKKLLQSVVNVPLEQFFKEFTLSESLYLIGEAWDSVPKTGLARSWSRLLSDSKNAEAASDEDVAEMLFLAAGIAELDGCTEDSIAQWLDGDKEGFYFCTEEDADFGSTCSDENLDGDQQEGPSHIEAYQCLDTVIQWFKKQEECSSGQLARLQDLHDLAASKVCGKIKQEKD